MKLPGSPQLDYRGNALYLEGCALTELARIHGTPVFVYSRAAMLDALGAYQQALEGRDHLVCYAMKANPSLAVLQTFAETGAGFDIVSGGELARALKVGADPGKIVFSGVGKKRSEMREALEADVLCFNVESVAELRVLSEVAVGIGRTARVSLRINPDIDAGTHPYISTGLKTNKFGIAHAEAISAYRELVTLPRLEAVGIDCHIGSQITETAPYLDALDRLLDLVERLESEGIELSHIDLGGGLGIHYTTEDPPAPQALLRALAARLDARGHRRLKIIVEPGRSLVGNAGVLVAEVLYLKQGQDRNFCIVDAAMNDLLRPALYQASMGIVECRRREVAALHCDVVGPVCESGDWLGHDRDLAVEAGDFIAILSAGAYGMSMASNYNARGRAAEVMVSGSNAWLIRERERVDWLFEHERLLPRR